MPQKSLPELPESKYPRSYSEEQRARVLRMGNWKGSRPGRVLPGNPSVTAKSRSSGDRFTESSGEYDRALSSGERRIIKKLPPRNRPRVYAVRSKSARRSGDRR